MLNRAGRYFARGKLLLSGEYFVLDGALALALPLKIGQWMETAATNELGRLHWTSLSNEGHSWFEAFFSLPDLSCEWALDGEAGRRLQALLQAAAAWDTAAWDPMLGYRVTTGLDFPREWGLGSSSTLVSLVAQWTGADPFHLLNASFGGSGYDVACAQAFGPLLYQRRERPHFVEFPFHPPFHQALYFVYLGRKQDSRSGIAHYRERVGRRPELVDQISRLTAEMATARSLEEFEAALLAHELLVAETVQLPRAAHLHFDGYWGQVKSLGAWGGDFVLLTNSRPEADLRDFLRERGFDVFFPYAQLAGKLS